MRTSALGLNGLLTDLAVPHGDRVFSAGLVDEGNVG